MEKLEGGSEEKLEEGGYGHEGHVLYGQMGKLVASKVEFRDHTGKRREKSGKTGAQSSAARVS